MTLSQIEEFQASVKRCLEAPDFMKDFYDRFTGSSEEIREKFRNTDFERQFRSLADSLYVMALAVRGGPDNLARREMTRLSGRHKEMAVTPAMYDIWLECLLQAARAHDAQFSDELEKIWRQTLAAGIEQMRTGAPYKA
jgi:hemoglobin-like flavoprotein